MRRTYATSFPHDSRRRRKLLGTVFLTVNFLNRREIPHRLESHNALTARCPYDALTAVAQRKILRTGRRPYDALTAVAQRKTIHTARRPYDVLTAVAQRTHCQTSLRRTDCSRTTKTNLRRSYATLAS